VALLLVIAAAVAPSRFALSPDLPDTQVPLPDTPLLLDYALFALAAITAMAILTWIAWTTGNPLTQHERQRRMWGQLFIIGLIASGIALFAKTRSVLGLGDPRPGTGQTGGGTGQAIGDGPSDVNSAVLFGMFLGATVLVIALAVHVLRRRAELGREQNFDLIYDELGHGIEDLKTIAQPRNAVIACYVRMERALAGAGTRRRHSDTPLELLERMLAERKVSGDAPAQLTSLFEIAKFSTRPVDEPMRAKAIDALVEIRMQLTPEQEPA
jgi:hypothetical protein